MICCKSPTYGPSNRTRYILPGIVAKALLLVPPTELEIFYHDFVAKALLLVPPTELEIFQQNLVAKALVLVNPTVVELIQRDLVAKTLLLVIPTVGIVEDLSTSYKSPNFGKTFCKKNIQPLAPPERLSTVSSPFMVRIIEQLHFKLQKKY